MKYRLVIHRIAELEVSQAVLWYSEKAGLGREIGAAFRATIHQIKQNPFAFQVCFGNARRALVSRFPYKIFYTIESGNVIRVFGVLHAKQSTSQLRGRLH